AAPSGPKQPGTPSSGSTTPGTPSSGSPTPGAPRNPSLAPRSATPLGNLGTIVTSNARFASEPGGSTSPWLADSTRTATAVAPSSPGFGLGLSSTVMPPVTASDGRAGGEARPAVPPVAPQPQAPVGAGAAS